MNLVKPEVRDTFDLLTSAIDASETAISDYDWAIARLQVLRRHANQAKAYALACDLGYQRAADKMNVGREHMIDMVREHRKRTGAPTIDEYRDAFKPDTDWDLSHYVTLD